MKILIADDDPQLIRALSITLNAHHYDVVTAYDGAQAITVAAAERPHLILIDLGMPRLSGIQAIEALRGWTTVPIIVVSGRTGSADIVAALDVGADDYVTKPFQINELLARLRALSRRQGADGNNPVVRFGDITVDLAAKTVRRNETIVHLTPTEWRMLDFLARSPGALVTRQTLLKEIWGAEVATDSSYLRLYISQLRRKLERNPAHPRHILTEQGMGYRLELE